jgi:hypothetical protein
MSPTFAEVRAIFKRSCAVTKCHHNGGGNEDLDLRDNDGLYQRLMGSAPNTTKEECRDRTIVVPGNLDGSLLAIMLGTDDGPRMGCGTQMPDDCPEKRDCLSDEDTQTILDWIAGGAPEQ